MKPEANNRSHLLGGLCHCGREGVVIIGGDRTHAAYCMWHLDDALIAVEQIRLADEAGR